MPAGGRQVLAYSQWSHSGNKLLRQKVGAWLNSATKINDNAVVTLIQKLVPLEWMNMIYDMTDMIWLDEWLSNK